VADTLYDHPCSRCGVFVVFTDARNTLGDLADHRLCPVPTSVDASTTTFKEK
jgi:hypothetical protein